MLKQLVIKHINALRWIANICFVGATFIMLSPVAASHSITPWLLFVLGNIIWLVDVALQGNVAWAMLSAYFVIWDSLLMCSRIFNFQLVSFFAPIISVLEKLP